MDNWSIILKIFYTTLALFLLSGCSTTNKNLSNSNDLENQIKNFTCKEHDNLTVKIFSWAKHQFYYGYNTVDKLSHAEAQLFLIKQKTKIGSYAKEFHKKNILYNLNKKISTQKGCDTSFYQSPIDTFEYGVKILKYYNKRNMTIDKNQIKNEDDFYYKHKGL